MESPNPDPDPNAPDPAGNGQDPTPDPDAAQLPTALDPSLAPPYEPPVYRTYAGRSLSDAQKRAFAEQREAWQASYVSTGQSWDESRRVLTVRYERAPGSVPVAQGTHLASWQPGYSGPQSQWGQASSVAAWRIVLALFVIVALGVGAVAANFGDQPPEGARTVIVAGADSGTVPRIEPVACKGPSFGATLPHCGDLIVPEDRAQPNGTRIRIHYAVYPAQGLDVEPDPVVYLDGGPGGSPLTDGFLLEPFIDQRDVVVFDQRGTGFSAPSLDCPEIDALGVDLTPLDRSVAIRTCRDRLAGDGVDRADYTTAESASDVEDLRVALGYPAWNLYGISYGTRLALAVMRDHADGVRSAILDSVYPPNIDAYASEAPNAQRAFRQLFDGCAHQPSCATPYPDLERTFFDTVDRLDREHPRIAVEREGATDATDVELDGDILIQYLFEQLYDSDAIPFLPLDLSRIAASDYAALKTYLSTSSLFGRHSAGSGTIAEGMELSVQCGEEVPFSAGDPSAGGDRDTQRMIDAFTFNGIRQACELWDVPRAEPRVKDPVRSEIPTLLMAGQFDPITPPAWADSAARTLPRGQVLVFPAVGHGVVGTTTCADGLVTAFLVAPTTPADARCIGNLPGPVFEH